MQREKIVRLRQQTCVDRIAFQGDRRQRPTISIAMKGARTVLIGVDLPMRGPLATPVTMTRLAQAAEDLGYGYITLGDHIVIPNQISAPYPYAEDGDFPAAARAGRHELLTTISFLAAKTTRIRFMTGIFVVPHRPAMLAAKMLATIDILSGSRLTVACGSGWLKEEFEAIAAPPFDRRGTVTDEHIRAFRELWTSENPTFDGEFVKFSGITFSPKPEPPGPPLWIGGESPAALKRAARMGDGWYPIGSNPTHPLDTLERYCAAVARLRQLTAEAGRDPAAMGLGYFCMHHGATNTQIDGRRGLFLGSPDDIAGDLAAMREMGVGYVDFRLGAPTVEETIANMTRFQSETVSRMTAG